VPVAKLSETCTKLLRLFVVHGYDDAVIFGHAKDGNIHFLVNENFDSAASVARYRSFTEDMVDMVLAAGGTLKAEHGTGRIMAPFVERQYGPELYTVMREIKRACDPNGILNPDIILTTDGDCRVPPSWIMTMVKTMRNQGAVAVSGPVTLTGTSRFAQLQSMEFGSLVVTGGATLGHGWATMCNGANLGYYRHAFVKVRGYEGVEHQPSGDDEFLWHRLAAHYPGQLAFAPTSSALVRTAAATTWHQFVQQRTRWASKWDQYDGLAYSLLAAGLGLWYFGTLVLIGLALVGTISWAQLAIFLSNKLLADCLLLLPTYQQLGIRWRTSAFMIVGLGYPIYAAYFAFRTLLGRGFEWKGRTY
jgi:hypothetical protein